MDQLLDTRSLAKPREFTGTDTDWPAWAFQFRAYVGLLSRQLHEQMEQSERLDVDPSYHEMDGDAQSRARVLYHLLVLLCPKGRPVTLLMRVEPSNGYAAWRALLREYEPAVAGRHSSMLAGLISPVWTTADFREKFVEWEVALARYEQQSGEVVSQRLRIAVVSKHAPPEIRNAIRSHIRVIGDSYAQLRQVVSDYLTSGLEFNSSGVPVTAGAAVPDGPTPMDVGAVFGGKKGKKGKGKKGKGKGENEAKGKSSHGKGKGSGPGAPKGNGGPGHGKGADYFPGACSSCGQWGHKRAHCPKKGDSQVGAVGSSSSSVVHSSISTVNALSANALANEVEQAYWIMSLQIGAVTEGDRASEVMLDSGSEEHVCSPALCPGPLNQPMSTMRDVAGRPVPNHGSKRLEMSIGQAGEEAKCQVTWQVGPVERNVLSVGKLVDTGFYRVVFDAGESYLENKVLNRRLRLTRRGRVYVLPVNEVKVVGGIVATADAVDDAEPSPTSGGASSQEGPVVVVEPPRREDLRPEVAAPDVDRDRPMEPAGLKPWSPVEAMRGWLRAAGAPIYGTKDMLWKRVLEYNELVRKEAALQEQLAQELEARRLGQGSRESAAVPLPAPRPPTEAEKEAHALTHVPAKPWCRLCVMGKSKQLGHRRIAPDEAEREGALVEMDYCFLKATGETTTVAAEAWSTTLVVVHRGTGLMVATAVEKKGAEGLRNPVPDAPGGYVVQVVLTFLKQLCLDTVILQTDGEVAILELAENVAKERHKPTRLRVTPTRSSQSNGAVESAVGRLAAQVRTLRAQVEEAYDTTLNPNMCVWPWLVRHAAWVLGRFSIRASGRTAYEEAYDSEWRGDLCPFAETIMYRESSSYTGALVQHRRRKKADPAWARGLWLGRAEKTNEHIVGTPTGIYLTRNVRRLPPGDQASRELLVVMRGVPWEPREASKPGRPKRLPNRPLPDAEIAPALPEASVPEKAEEITKPPEEVEVTVTNRPEEKAEAAMGQDAAMDPGPRTPPAEAAASSDEYPSPTQVRRFWTELGVEERAKKARIAGLSVDRDTPEPRETVHEDWEAVAFGQVLLDDELMNEEESQEDRQRQNRLEEIRVLEKFKAFKPVPAETAVGKKVLPTRFVDTVEKSRFVAKEFNTYVTDDYYAQATTVTTNKLIDLLAARRRYARLILDVHRAFLHLVEDEEIYVVPPVEWQEQFRDEAGGSGQLWQMLRVLYGRRKAPRMWLDFLGGLLVEHCGMVRSRSAPHFFRSCDGQVVLEVHMDDIYGCGPSARLSTLVGALRREVEIKHAHVFEPGSEDGFMHLRRERYLVPAGCYIRANPSYIDKAAEVMGMMDSKPAPTPLAGNDRNDGEEQGVALGKEEHHLYRKVVGVLLYVAHDRGDVAYAVRLLAMDLVSPTEDSWRRLKRVVRYLYHTRNLATYFPQGDGNPMKELTVFTDSDWAGDRRTRKSASCAVLVVEDCVLAVICRGQAVRAQSSAEAEAYAAVMGAKEAIHLQELLAWMGEPVRIRLRMDSSAGRSVLLRRGVGRIRHLEVKVLWIQDETARGRLLIDKVPGDQNTADIGTKPLGQEAFERHRGGLGLRALKAELVKKVVGLLIAERALTRVGGQELCLKNDFGNGVVLAEPLWAGPGWYYLMVCPVFVVLGLVTLTGVVAGWFAARSCGRPGEQAAGIDRGGGPERRTVMVQGPVTYTRWRNHPRYLPLPEHEFGAWECPW